ncbi:MAG TPA: glycosyltransferase [Gaiellaceae bacterium]|nr:glycosyltransferase [Gaiellaceae bacterium]
MRLLVIGASSTDACGVRDCASVLEPELRELGAEVETLWWDRLREPSADAWLKRLRERRADAVLWHYAPTPYGPHGVPTLAPRVAAAARRAGAVAVPFLHELAYDFGRRGWRGFTHAVSQRAALVPVVRAAAGCLVTTEDRLEWLRSRRWLPARPLAFTPVPANVPSAAGPPARSNGHLRIGVFGFRSGGGVDPGVVVEAVSAIPDARLVLVGAPGPASPEGRSWLATATDRACALEFTGVLEPEPLAAALAGLDIVVSADPAGPTPRKGSVAAALALGRPVVALDGPSTWRPLVDEGGVVVAARERLAEALSDLAASAELRARSGELGREFYARTLSARVVAATVLDFVELVGGRP